MSLPFIRCPIISAYSKGQSLLRDRIYIEELPVYALYKLCHFGQKKTKTSETETARITRLYYRLKAKNQLPVTLAAVKCQVTFYILHFVNPLKICVNGF
jgi:hypothetical protein